MRFLVGGIAHETNTFANVKTDVAAFKQWEWAKGEAIMQNRGVRNYIGGMIDQADALNIEIEPLFSAFASPSGIITAKTHDLLLEHLMKPLKQAKEYDAVILSLHGAGVSERTEDFEGAILQEVRDVVGFDVPIVVTLDLHANMTQKMVDLADVILGNHLYPHTDSYDIGKEAIEIAQKIVTGSLKPTMHLELLPLIIPTSTTNLSPAKSVNEWCFDAEKIDGVVDCTFYHGFPYTNIGRFGVSVVVTTNDDAKLAKEMAEAVGQAIWQKRDQFLQKHPSPEEGIQQALAYDGRPVVINETSDNPGAGTPGDGTYLLKALIEANLTDACFAFIYDPEVVQRAMEAGVGVSLDVEVGGKTDELHGESIPVRAYVKVISDGIFTRSSPMGRGQLVNLGPSVRLQTKGIDFIVCSQKAQVFDDEIFKLHGIDIQQYKIVGLKSSQHFRAGFEHKCANIITVDSPGLSTDDFTTFNFSKLETKLYPLHPVTYE